MSRPKHAEEPENHERWMVSYADFLTLLFAFFTCLYAISTVDAAKMGQMVASMKASFGGQAFSQGARTIATDSGGGISSSVLLKNPGVEKKSDNSAKNEQDKSAAKTVLNGDADMGRFKRTLEAMFKEEIQKNIVRIHLERRGLIITLSEKGMFDSGSIEIKPEGKTNLDALATSLMTIGNYIRIEGHADNVPINTARFPSNWELSSARATAVLNRMIISHGMPQELFSVSGYGEWKPVASNDTADGRARNRRVDIVILNPSAAELEPLRNNPVFAPQLESL